MPRSTGFFAVLIGLLLPLSTSFAGELDGSPSSMSNQHEVAVESDYSFLRTSKDVRHLVELGRLVPVEGNAHYTLSKVSYPFARPEVLSFIEHLAIQYHEALGSKLVVTSLTRPERMQPRNAHDLSVHPAGMAVDLRVPLNSRSRAWLEETLLKLEGAGSIDVTRERHPPHYHVAVFREEYLPIAARQDSVRAIEDARRAAEKAVADSIRAANAPVPENGGIAGFLIGTVALVGVTAPFVRRAHRTRAERRRTARL